MADLTKRTVAEINSNFGGRFRIQDADNDGLLIDDILRKKSGLLTLPLAGAYLTELSQGPVEAHVDPRHPERITWQIEGKDAFALVKKDETQKMGIVEYQELTGPTPDAFSLTAAGSGTLFSLNPLLIRRDYADGLEYPWVLRGAPYWKNRYAASAETPILTADEIAQFNQKDSKEVDKLDYALNEIPSTMKKRDVVALMAAVFGLESQSHLLAPNPCDLGAGGQLYTGTLADKGAEWSLKDWEEVAARYNLPVTAKSAAGMVCEKEGIKTTREKGFVIDFTQAVPDPDYMLAVGYGIIVTQTDLRSIPSDRACYSDSGEGSDDACQYHRPHIEPVRILWQGNGWTFVKTQQEYGWIQSAHLAIASGSEVERLLKGDAVVTDFTVEANGVRLGMGTRLPLIENRKEGLTVGVPMRGKDGGITWKEVDVPHAKVKRQPAYSYANFITALLTEGTEGVWLLANKAHAGVEGVDCSGLTKMAAEIFGLLLGRNSGSAQALAGKRIWERPAELAEETALLATSTEQAWKRNVAAMAASRPPIDAVFQKWHDDMLAGTVRGPLLLGWSGHVAIFLGLDEKNRPIVISSLARTLIADGPGDESQPWNQKTTSLWTLGPVVTPLDIKTDGREVPRPGGRLVNWYGRITFIQELIPSDKK